MKKTTRKKKVPRMARRVTDDREYRFVKAVIGFMNAIGPQIAISKMMSVGGDSARAYDRLLEELDVFAPAEEAE